MKATAALDAEDGGGYPEELYSFDHQIAVAPAPTRFSAHEVDRYHRDGFLGVSALLSPAEVSAALDGLAAVLADPRDADVQYEAWAPDRIDGVTGEQRMDLVRRLMRFTGLDERLLAVASSERLLGLVRTLVGEDVIVLFQDMALLKPPGGGREKPWHQDNAFFTFEPGTPIVGVWIALDEATPDNGCMHLRPGSHRDGPLVHFRRRDWQLCDDDVLAARELEPVSDVMVPLPAGGAVFFDGLVHHGTPANRTDTRRRALQFHYVPASVVPVSDQRRLAIFGSEGKNVSC